MLFRSPDSATECPMPCLSDSLRGHKITSWCSCVALLCSINHVTSLTRGEGWGEPRRVRHTKTLSYFSSPLETSADLLMSALPPAGLPELLLSPSLQPDPAHPGSDLLSHLVAARGNEWKTFQNNHLLLLLFLSRRQ